MSPLGENRVETVGEEGHKVHHINVYNLTPTHLLIQYNFQVSTNNLLLKSFFIAHFYFHISN